MPGYSSITERFVGRQEDNIAYSILDDKTTCFQRNVITRMQYASLAILSPMIAGIDTAIGCVGGVVACIQCGYDKDSISFATTYLHSSREIISRFFINLVRTLNPNASFPEVKRRRSSIGYETLNPDAAYIQPGGEGVLTYHIGGSIKSLAKRCIHNEEFCSARLSYGLLGIVMIITRVVDAVLGMVAACFSLLFVGHFESVNNFAARGLQGPTAIIYDVMYCALKCMTVKQ